MQDFGKLLLRLAIGGLLLLHGIGKIQHMDMAMGFVGGLLGKHGLPDWIKFGVYVGEVIAPVLVLAGFLTRLGGLAIAINMGMAIYLARLEAVGTLNQGGGWGIELEALFLLGGLAILCLGAGRISVRRGVPKID